MTSSSWVGVALLSLSLSLYRSKINSAGKINSHARIREIARSLHLANTKDVNIGRDSPFFLFWRFLPLLLARNIAAQTGVYKPRSRGIFNAKS